MYLRHALKQCCLVSCPPPCLRPLPAALPSSHAGDSMSSVVSGQRRSIVSGFWWVMSSAMESLSEEMRLVVRRTRCRSVGFIKMQTRGCNRIRGFVGCAMMAVTWLGRSRVRGNQPIPSDRAITSRLPGHELWLRTC
jgi:hypothetical protein